MFVAAKPLNLELLGATLALVGLILLGAVAVFWAGKRLKRPTLRVPRPEDELSRYRTLCDQDLLSKDEFERIRVQLEKKASKAQTAAPEAPASAPAQDAPP